MVMVTLMAKDGKFYRVFLIPLDEAECLVES